MNWLRFSAITCFSFFSAIAVPAKASVVTNFSLTFPQTTLTGWNTDWSLLHEAKPYGVPTGYDWAAGPRMGAGNTVPSGFTAFTGWAQIFRTPTSTTVTAPLQMRNFQTLVCYGPNHTWAQIQQGDISGAAFAPDFVGNVNQPATISKSSDYQNVSFALDSAFHFWPAQGRALLPSTTSICGFVVMMEARINTTDQSLAGDYILGFGIDYWSTLTAAWNQQYTTNKDVGIGRLKKVGLNWAWFGMSTASNADLQSLFNQFGVVTTTTSPPSAPVMTLTQ